jgi:hypothetical protein
MPDGSEAGLVGQQRFKLNDLQVHGVAALVYGAFVLLQALSPFSITRIVVAGLFGLGGLWLLAARRGRRGEDDIREIRFDDAGFVATTFSGSKVDFGWSEMSLVRFSNARKKHRGFIEVEGRGLRGVLREDVFQNYAVMYGLIRKRCEEKRVKTEVVELDMVEERPSEVLQGREIISDTASVDPRVVFRIAMYVVAGILFFILLVTWGSTAYSIMLLIFWFLLWLAWAHVPGILPTKMLRVFKLTEAGVFGITFSGRQIEMPWAEVSEVVVFSPDRSGSKGAPSARVTIRGRRGVIKAGWQFSRMPSLIVEISKACGQRNIKLRSVEMKSVEARGSLEVEDSAGREREDDSGGRE